MHLISKSRIAVRKHSSIFILLNAPDSCHKFIKALCSDLMSMDPEMVVWLSKFGR
ncbi:hypothetical protein HKBW3S25_00147 [Candidatus Hakubella thermalkaliphila]|uniref:Uncharacterized protein n=1 Tax=Candidatus Hakubella thermalkaliphila TaxID=2754717 RepID=A0A6V8NZ53_9ACTN|nr:hypothetical protein HKBW3S25_00147 [Candidatus Hakubella thermalkaliphila]